MIPSPTATEACVDPTKAANTCPFNLNPVGAGAFMVASYKPDDSINHGAQSHFLRPVLSRRHQLPRQR